MDNLNSDNWNVIKVIVGYLTVWIKDCRIKESGQKRVKSIHEVCTYQTTFNVKISFN